MSRLLSMMLLLIAAPAGCALFGSGTPGGSGGLPGGNEGAAPQAGTPAAAPSPAPSAPPSALGLQLVAEGLTAPLVATMTGDGSGRLFIADQAGIIRVVGADGKLQAEPFLDLRDRMIRLNPSYDERGLLGLAFHPNFRDNGRFFVYYSAPLRPGGPAGWNHTSHVSEFKVTAGDPNRADPGSERVILQVDEPQANHNGGQIVFGPDGYLYIPLGDGGGANDVGMGHGPLGNAQDKSVLLGKILRIDVDGGDPYGIPPDNPFVGQDERPEVYAYGLRNPFRISFDREGSRQLFAGDVGQNQWEEVDIIVKGGNYGWHIKEGTHCFDPQRPMAEVQGCSDTGAGGEPLIDPIIEYPNAARPDGLGQAVIGGYIYRGRAVPGLAGAYVFGDWNSGGGDGSIFVGTPPVSGQGPWPMAELRIANRANGRLGEFLLSFGQDEQGELYALTSQQQGPTGSTGKVYRIIQAS